MHNLAEPGALQKHSFPFSPEEYLSMSTPNNTPAEGNPAPAVLASPLVSADTPISFAPDTVSYQPQELLETALINQVGTMITLPATDRETVRVPHLDGTPPVGFVAEGSEIPLEEAALAEVQLKTKKLAALHQLSNELLAPTQGQRRITEETMYRSLQSGIIQAADKAFVTNNDDVLQGLGVMKGITNAGTLGDSLDQFIDAVGQVEAEGGKPDEMFVIGNPLDWAALAKLKTAADSNQPLIQTTSQDDIRRRNVAGIPFIGSRYLDKGKIIIGDKSNVLTAATATTLDADTSTLFRYDSTLLRIKLRIGWTVLNPKRIAVITTK